APPAVLGVGRVLSLAPLRYLGDRSYAFYLWHWPVLILAAQSAGHDLSLGAKLALVAFAFLLSVVSYRFVEDPIRRMRFTLRVTGLLWPASATAAVVVVLFILGSLDRTAGRFEAAAAAVQPAQLVDVILIIGSWMAVWAPERAIKPVGALGTAMKRVSASVIVVGDPPGQKRDPTDCLLAPRATMATCTSEATRIQLATNRAIAAHAR